MTNNNINNQIAQLSPAKRALLEQRLKQKAAHTVAETSIPRLRDRDSAPLSFSQTRMWFLDQLEPGNAAYNRPSNIHITGQLNVTVLEQSLNEIIRRHDILRTYFPAVDGQPTQVISPTLTLSLAIIDLSYLPKTQQESEIQRLAIQEAQQPFDVSKLPLIRATLLQQAQEDYILLITFHHIIFDGWSMGVLIQELAALYQAFSTDQPNPLPELPIQYADFATWQRQRFQGERLQSQLAYWKQQLGGELPILELPTDRPRGAIQTFRGAKEVLILPRTLSDALKALSQREGVTLFMTLLAAFQTLLYRYTGQEDIIVGTPIAGRDRTETEKLIGVFINTLVLRTQIQGNLTFRELLSRVREVALAAYDNQDVPFEKLVEELQPERDLSRPPLFQVLFQLRNFPNYTLETQGLKIENFNFDTGIAMLDLSLEIAEESEGLACIFKYNIDLFDETTIQGMKVRLQALLEEVVTAPERQLLELIAATNHDRQPLTFQPFSCYLIGHESLLIPCANSLLERGHQLLGMISSGAAIADWANSRKIPHIQPTEDLVEFLSKQHFDYLFSINNLVILPEIVINSPRKFAINCHDALLPKFAGINAPSWAIFHQEKIHGITWHKITQVIDGGDIVKQISINIAKNETAFTLNSKCYELTLQSFSQLIDDISSNQLVVTQQNLAQRSYFSIAQKPSAGCLVSWRLSANEIDALVRGLEFGSYENWLGMPKLAIGNEFVIISQIKVLDESSNLPPGTLVAIQPNSLKISTTSHDILLLQVLTIEGKTLSISEFVFKYGLQVGYQFKDIEPNLVKRLGRLEALFFKHERFWVERLATLKPITIPSVNLAVSSQLPVHEITRKKWLIPEQVKIFFAHHQGSWTRINFCVAVFVAYMARINETYCFDFGLKQSQLDHQLAELEEFFASEVPCRIDISDQQSFEEVCDSVTQQLESIQKHKTYSRDILLRYPELRGLREQGFDHKFPVIIELVDKGDESTRQSTNGLTFIVSKNEEQCYWVYDARIFDHDSIARMLEQFTTFVQHSVTDTNVPLADLNLLSDKERHKILVEWNKTPTNISQDLSIHQLFEVQATQNPNAIAVEFGNQKLTYQELNERANQLAHYLQTLAVQPETRLGLCIERSLEMLIGLLGILKAGGAYVPLDPTYPIERLNYMVSDAQLSLVLTQDKFKSLFSSTNIHQVCLDREWSTIAQESRKNLISKVTPDNLAYVIYTSGSTGKPKGVMIEHQSLVNFTQAASSEYRINESDRILQFASISFDAATEEIYPCLVSGGTLVLRTDEMLGSVATFLKACQDGKLTILDLPTAYWQQIVSELATTDVVLPESLRLVIIGGERALPESVKLWRERVGNFPQLINTYGPTEATVVATTYPITTSTPINQEVPIGRAIANVQTYILDGNLQPVPIGIPGELHIGGLGLARGYLNRPELTQETFIVNPFSNNPNTRLYKTGDRVRYLKDGNIEFIGRLDHQVKIRGFRIELGEVEAVFSQHPQVQEAVVIAAEDEAENKRLVAYFVANSAQVITDELRSFLKTKLPDYMIPSAFVQLDTLPLTANGKIDRRALPAPEPEDTLSTNFIPPRTATEEQLAQIWTSVLGIKQVGLYNNFFELGGHSLLATQVISRIRQFFEIELPLRCLFEAPTIAELSKHLETKRWSKTSQEIHPVVRNQDIPLSFAQQRLWFLDQLEGESATYNISRALHLVGNLNLTALEQTLQTIVERHETLRTSFQVVDDAPVQIITPRISLNLPVIDLQQFPTTEQSTQVQQFAKQDAQTPFNLTQAPLLRVTLLRLDEQSHVLLLTIHHIISDGWSMGVLIRELSSLYQAFSGGKPNPLPPLFIQYADFAAWQREWLQGDVLSNQINYWKAQLTDAPRLLELPTDYPRPPVQTFRGSKQQFQVNYELTRRLKTVSRQSEATLFMTLLAAFVTLLYRYSSQIDLVIGSPIANRNRNEIESLIGFFVNTLALRINLDSHPSYRELLARVRQIALDAYAHQDLPFEKLIEELQPERSLSYSPLFQVMFVLQNAPSSSLELLDLTLTSLEVDTETAKFDLLLSMSETEQGLRGVWEYNTDLFDQGTITRMGCHFKILLEGIVANPGQSISQLPLLTETERHQLLVEWNNTQTNYPQDKCIHQLFEEQVERTPDAVAVVFEEQQLTYRELNHRANQLAHYLQTLGVQPNHLVGICVDRSLDMIVGLLAILKAGGAYVPLDPTYPIERLAYMLTDAQVSVLLTQETLSQRLPSTAAYIINLDTDDLLQDNPWSIENPLSNLQREDLTYVIYTSGSTGQPKGVAMNHRSLCNLIQWQIEQSDGGKTLQFSPLSFDVSFQEIFSTLCSGGTLVLISDLDRREPQVLLNLLTEAKIARLFLPFVALQQLAEAADNFDVSSTSLREVITAGEQLQITPSITRFFSQLTDCRLSNQYGPSESHVVTAFTLPKDTNSWQARPPIGCPISNTQIYLLDSHFQPVPIGVPGELHIGGDGLARGYLNRPELTKEKFIPNPFSNEPDARLYKTGDIARYLPDGTIEFMGRIDNQVKIRGFRIELGEIEAVLSQYTQVQEAVVISREDQVGNKRLVAYFVANSAQAITAELRSFLKAKLPDYMVPSVFFQLDTLPLTPNGKVDRRALPKPEIEDTVSNPFIPPRNSTEEQLATIWSSVLGIERVGIHHNFFELGGHSLLATQVISRIRQAFAVELPLRALFEAPTVAELGDRIETIRWVIQPFASKDQDAISDDEQGEL